MRSVHWLALVTGIVVFAAPLSDANARVDAPPPVPAWFSEEQARAPNAQRERLMTEYEAIARQVREHNAMCRHVATSDVRLTTECNQSNARIDAVEADYRVRLQAFQAALATLAAREADRFIQTGEMEVAPPVLPDIDPEEAGILAEMRALLEGERQQWNVDKTAHNQRCRRVPRPRHEACWVAQGRLGQRLSDYRSAIQQYRTALQEADERAIAQVPARTNRAMMDYARSHGVDAAGLSRLERALSRLLVPQYVRADAHSIANAWSTIRQSEDDLLLSVMAMSMGRGVNVFASGRQSGNTCAWHALATATGRNYSDVESRIMRVLSAPWRREAQFDERLTGGEVVLVAEMLGQVEVVEPSQFRQTLEGGSPVLVALHSDAGPGASHQVVLSRTFSVGRDTWYEVVDSNAEHEWSRYFVRDFQLNMLLAEPGIAVRPDRVTPSRQR